MSYLDNYKAMAAGLTKGLRWARAQYGSRLVGTIGLMADLVAEGARQAFIARLPGHPEQAEDAAIQTGFDRDLIRYKYEPLSFYKVRLQNAWSAYQQGGTNIGVTREVLYCLNCIWAPLGLPDLTFISTAYARFFENGWAEHSTVLINPGIQSVTGSWSGTSEQWGSFSYGAPNKVWGASNVLIEDINIIRATLRKWLPSRTKGWILWSTSGSLYGVTATYGGGYTYDATAIKARISVE